MIDVKEVLRRWSAGHGERRIGREAGTDRKTVARYTEAAKKLGLERGGELTDEEVHQVAQCVQSRPTLVPSEEWNDVAQHRVRIESWLSGDNETRPLRLSKVHTLLVRDHGLSASYDTLWRYAQHELGWRKKACTVRVDDPPPGQEAQVDFGRMGLMLDPETGRQRVLWVLIVTLSFSRYQFVWPTFRQTTEVVCEGLDRAWMFFGAIVTSMIPDNTKAMIQDPDALSPGEKVAQGAAGLEDIITAMTLALRPSLRSTVTESRSPFEEKRRGKVIFVSSIGGLMAVPYGGPYATTKHAVEALAGSMKAELAPFGIQIQLINPGGYLTGFNETEAESATHWMNDAKNYIKSDVVQSFFNQILGVPENQLDPQLMADAMVSIVPTETGLFRNVVPKKTEDLARSVQRELWDARIDLPASGRKS